VDAAELNNLIDKPEHSKIQHDLAQQMHAYFDRVADPKWDIWKSGTSKTGLLNRKYFKNPGPAKPPR
jgi:hypothetical protein